MAPSLDQHDEVGLGYLLAENKTEASLCNFQSEEACPLMQEEAEHPVVRPHPSSQIYGIC